MRRVAFDLRRTSAVSIASVSSARTLLRDLSRRAPGSSAAACNSRFGLAGSFDQLADAGDDLLAALVAELDGAEHFCFGDLLRAGFHHHDAVLGAGDHDVELGFAAFRRRSGWRSYLPSTMPTRTPRQHVMEREYRKWPARRPRRRWPASRDRCSGRPKAPCAMICVSFRKPSGNSGRIGRSIRRLVRISFSEGRPSRLMKPPGNLSGGVGVLAIIDREREKARAGLGLVGQQAVTRTTDRRSGRRRRRSPVWPSCPFRG